MVQLITYRVKIKNSINAITGVIQEDNDSYIKVLLNNLQNGKILTINKEDIVSINQPE